MVSIYLTLMVLISSPFYYIIVSAGTLAIGGGIYVLGLMMAPGVSAVITRLAFQRNLRGMGWGWGPTRYQVASYLIPVCAALLVYGLVWFVGAGGFSLEGLGENSSALKAIATLATLGVLQSAIPAFGEELGWRGLLVPELAKVTDFTRIALISTVIWSVYHYPALLFADYTSSAPRAYALVMFTLGITGASFMATWLRLKSGSLWTGVLLHASHNLFIQGVFDRLTTDETYTQYVTTEFGAGLAMVYLGGGFWCWKHRGSLPNSTTAIG